MAAVRGVGQGGGRGGEGRLGWSVAEWQGGAARGRLSVEPR